MVPAENPSVLLNSGLFRGAGKIMCHRPQTVLIFVLGGAAELSRLNAPATKPIGPNVPSTSPSRENRPAMKTPGALLSLNLSWS